MFHFVLCVLQITKLQSEIDNEAEHRAELARSIRGMTDKKIKAAIEAKIEKSDEKLDSMTVLMLHYCAGLQHCLDQEEMERQKQADTLATVNSCGTDNDGSLDIAQSSTADESDTADKDGEEALRTDDALTECVANVLSVTDQCVEQQLMQIDATEQVSETNLQTCCNSQVVNTSFV